jgi:hypothetical protein
MSSHQDDEPLGRLDDDAEAAATSDDAPGGAAAAGEDDPAEGSPGTAHPVGEGFPDEAVRYDEPDARGRVEPD